jgi:hypothetical protein
MTAIETNYLIVGAGASLMNVSISAVVHHLYTTVSRVRSASGLGLFNSFRMLRLPDIEPSVGLEGAILG